MNQTFPGFSRPIAAAMLLVLGLAGRSFAADGAEAVPANSIRVGIYSVDYRISAQDVSGPFTPAGINLTVQHVNTLYLGFIRRLNTEWDLELATGIPPKTHTIGKGPATVGSVPFDGQEVATAKWFSPSLLLEYKFLGDADALRPYVGAGINYTRFYDLVSTPAGDAANGGPTRISLSSSIGPVATVGLVYRFTRELHATLSYSLARVNSNYESDTSGVIRRTTIHFNPRIVVASLGYAF